MRCAARSPHSRRPLAPRTKRRARSSRARSASRSEAVRDLSPAEMALGVGAEPRLALIEAMVEDLVFDPPHFGITGALERRGVMRGVVLEDGRSLAAPRVVVTPGTFMNGVMH